MKLSHRYGRQAGIEQVDEHLSCMDARQGRRERERERERRNVQAEEKSVIGGLQENHGDKDIKARARKALTGVRLYGDSRRLAPSSWESGPLGPPESSYPSLLSHGQALLQK